METRYLNIDARCVTVFDQLEERSSGGGRVYCTRLPRRREHPSPAPSGRKVLDLEEYRRQHFGGAQEPLRPESSAPPGGARPLLPFPGASVWGCCWTCAPPGPSSA